MDKLQVIKLWKELGIVYAEFEFSCGGDSMNDTTINLYDKNKKVVECEQIMDYLDSNVYKNVNFYEASDGHYIGESGVVHIELDCDSDDEEEHDFTYSKSSQAEFSERFTEVGEIKLTDEQIAFIEKNVSNINGGGDDSTTFNFKRDFIMTDDDERIQNELAELIGDYASDFNFEKAQGEAEEWYSFTTNDEDELDNLTIEDNCLKLVISRNFLIYQESED